MPTEAQAIEAVLNKLRANLGLGESPAGSNSNFIVDWYNANVDRIGNGPWCEMTNTWAMWTTGAKALKRGRAYTVWAAQDGQNKVNGSSWHYGTSGMRAGDQVYFDWGGVKGNVGLIDHTGTVEKVNGDGTFYVLEGNIDDKLRRMHRDGKYIVGYVRFDWSRIATSSQPDKPITTIAKEVLAGKWGNDPERSKSLKAAGYDPAAVQAEVNRLVSTPNGPTKSIAQVALEVIDGRWGDGANRITNLTAAGYNPSSVQAEVNRVLSAKSISKLAQEVIDGKWGVDPERTKRLRAAGYDPAAVQAEVNRRLR